MLLKPRFQKAIDRAAMVADITTASGYVNEWRRHAVDIDGDLAAAAHAEADRLEEMFDAARLEELIVTGGFDTSKPTPTSSDQTATHHEPGATT